MVISTILILSVLGGYFSVDHGISFEHLLWSHVDTAHHVLSHFLLVLGSFAEKSLESLDSSLGLD